MGIGFAIPSNMVKRIVKELVTKGKVTRGWLGVYIQKVTKDISDSLGFGKELGALVSDIIKGSPAEGSGIKVGDIIVSIDKVELRDVNHLRKIVAAKKPGILARLTLYRKGKLINVNIKIGKLPAKHVLAKTEKSGKEDALGLIAKDVDEKLAYRYKIKDTRGVVIVKIKRSSFAEKSGLLRGDMIKEIERKPVDNMKTYKGILSQLKGKKKILFLVKRAGVNKFIVVKMSSGE